MSEKEREIRYVSFNRKRGGEVGGEGRGINVGNVFGKRQRTSCFVFLSSSFLCSFLVWVLTFLLTSLWTGEKKERVFVLVKVMKEGLF